VYNLREGPTLREPPTASGTAPVVVDLDSPSGKSPARERNEPPSQQEAPAIDVTPLSFAAPLSCCLALTWKWEADLSETSTDDKGREVGASPAPAKDDFAAVVESLSLLVQEIASQVEPASKVPQEAVIMGRKEMDGMSMPSSGEDEGIGEQSSAPSWWAVAGFSQTFVRLLRLFFLQKPLSFFRKRKAPQRLGVSNFLR
jgi:hypothetical protein